MHARGIKALAAMMFLALSGGAATAQETPRIVAVNAPLAEFAQRLVGDGAEVVYPIPEGTDPSFWRPSIADISAVQTADLVLLNGAGFATWTSKVSLPRSRVVDTSAVFQDRYIATETVSHSHGDGGAHSHTGTASYTWLDPELAAMQAEAVAAALVARGLASEEAVAPRLEALVEDLADLDARAEALLAETADTVFVATHPRYQYLARAYGLNIVSLEWDAGAAPDAEQIADLARVVEEEGARVLLWEAEPPASARADVAALGLEDVVFSPLATPGEAGFATVYWQAVQALVQAAQRSGSG